MNGIREGSKDYRAYVADRTERLLAESLTDLPLLEREIVVVDARTGRTTPISTAALFDPGKPGLFVVANEPGAGKSVLLAAAMKALLRSGNQDVALGYAQMAQYRSRGALPELLASGILDPSEYSEKIRGGALVILDAIDESPVGDVGAVFEDILDWARSIPGIRVVCSCRSATVPAWVPKEFTRVRILPLDDRIVGDALRTALHAAGRNALGTSLYEVLNAEQMRPLYSNPLLLSMAVAILAEGDLPSSGVQIQSRVDLYSVFLDWLEWREQQRIRSTSRSTRALVRLRRPALRWIAYEMSDKGRPSVDTSQLQQWLAEFLQLPQTIAQLPSGVYGAELLELLIDSPPLREIEVSPHGPLHITFMHPSYADYFLAEEIRRRHPDLVDFLEAIRPGTPRSFELIYYAVGTAADPGQELVELTRVATRRQDRELLRGAVHTLAALPFLPAELADNLVIRVLDAFKYWQKPFDYELLYSVSDIYDRVSLGFPARLKRDLQRLQRKYASTVPRFISDISESGLKVALDAEADPAALVDIFYTICCAKPRMSKSKDFSLAIVRKLEGLPDPSARAQGIACLSVLAERATLDFLHSVARNANEDILCRVHALSAIGNIGASDSLELVVSLLRDVSAASTYVRDSASWSLQLLGASMLARGEVNGLQRVVNTYRWCLRLESRVEEDNYALGNVLYSIARLDLRDLTADVVRVLRTTSSAYVREDAIYALGVMNATKFSGEIARCTRDPDAAVRARAVEALASLNSSGHSNVIKPLCEDEFMFVAEAAEQALAGFRDEVLVACLRRGHVSEGLFVAQLSADLGEKLQSRADRLYADGIIQHRLQILKAGGGVEARMTTEARAELLRSLGDTL